VPEGHLIHHLAEQHARDLAGRPTRATSPQGRFAEEASRVDGRLLEEVEAYGKHLFYRWDADVVHVHLGKEGLFLRSPAPASAPRRGVRLRLENDEVAVDLIAPRVCELIDPAGRDAVARRLGPDPLRGDTDAGAVIEALRRTARPIGVALLDQSVIAGVGNVLRAEALALARTHPSTPADRLSTEEVERLWTELLALMRRSKELGRIRTLDAGADASDAETRLVYKCERCGRCGTPVVTSEVGGRTAYHCPRCQPGLGTGQT
jgi:endonuclease VIII